MSGRSRFLDTLRDRARDLRLATKINLSFAAVGAIGMILAAWALDQTIRPAFDGLERAAVEQQVAQAQALLNNSLSSIESATKDYAVWTDSYNYIANKNPAFEADTFTTLALVNLDVNAIGYVRFTGEVLYTYYVDLEEEKDRPALAAAFEQVAASDRIRTLARTQSSFADFVELDGRILVIAGAQVFQSDGTGSPAGYVVMAREFSDAGVSETLQIASRVTLDVAPGSAFSTRDAWRVVVPVSAPGGASAGSLTFEVPRDMSRLGAATIVSALLTSALVMAGTLLTVFLTLRVFVIKRLAGIDAHMHEVATDGDLAMLKEDPSLDELGELTRSFNTMIAELRALRAQLDAQSFQLGQSESAAGAMHNVRNSLSPVTVILSQAISEQAPASAQHIAQAIRELSCADTAEDRRARLTAFLSATFDDLDRRAAARREMFIAAKASLAEALDIIRSQSDTAHRDIPVEEFDILDVIRKSASLARIAPWGEIDIDLPAQGMLVRANRLLTSQVIGNLLTNAVESLLAADRQPGHLSITLGHHEDSAGAVVSLTITDDGKGFEPEIAAKLFERGHSSNTSRSGGLGLHWCANTVRAMAGSLSLESDGPGKGARAIMQLRGASSAVAGDLKTGILAA